MNPKSRKLALSINNDICVGCYACEIACKQEHNLPVGPRLIRVQPEEPREIDGKPQLRNRVEYCRQCIAAPCQSACPQNAISTRDDGIVVIDEELCNGCGVCIKACTFGVMQFDDIKKLALKCDLCVERLDKSLQPACISSCPSHCISINKRR